MVDNRWGNEHSYIPIKRYLRKQAACQQAIVYQLQVQTLPESHSGEITLYSHFAFQSHLPCGLHIILWQIVTFFLKVGESYMKDFTEAC